MGILSSALKSTYIRLGGTGGYSVPPSGSVIYQSPWEDTRSVLGTNVTVDLALGYVPFFAGVRLLAESVGRLPLVLYRRVGEDDRERARDKQMYGMLHDEPNPAMSAMAFRSALHGHVITRGNGYAERVRDDLGRDRELWPLRPDKMSVLYDTETGQKFYRYRIDSLGDEIDLTSAQVFHVPGFGYDGRIGYGLVSLFRESIALGLSTQEFGTRFFKSGARPAGIITHPKGMSKEAVGEFAASFRNATTGLSNAQRLAVIEEGFSYQSVGVNPDDAQFLETRKFQRGEAAMMLGVPPHMIGDVERSTSWGSGIEEQTLGFVTFSLGASLETWQQETNRQLVRPAYPDMYAEFELGKLLQSRPEDRMRVYQGLFGMGVVNAETIARKENLPAPGDGSGATYYVPANYRRSLGVVEEVKPAAQSLSDVVDAVGALIRAGFQPDAVLAALNQPKIPHLGLEPITLTEQTPSNGNGKSGVNTL